MDINCLTVYGRSKETQDHSRCKLLKQQQIEEFLNLLVHAANMCGSLTACEQ